MCLFEGRLVIESGTPADDALAVQATTEWVFTNNQGHPRRIPTEVVKVFRPGLAEGTGENPGRA